MSKHVLELAEEILGKVNRQRPVGLEDLPMDAIRLVRDFFWADDTRPPPSMSAYVGDFATTHAIREAWRQDGRHLYLALCVNQAMRGILTLLRRLRPSAAQCMETALGLVPLRLADDEEAMVKYEFAWDNLPPAVVELVKPILEHGRMQPNRLWVKYAGDGLMKILKQKSCAVNPKHFTLALRGALSPFESIAHLPPGSVQFRLDVGGLTAVTAAAGTFRIRPVKIREATLSDGLIEIYFLADEELEAIGRAYLFKESYGFHHALLAPSTGGVRF